MFLWDEDLAIDDFDSKCFGADVRCCSPFIPSIHLHSKPNARTQGRQVAILILIGKQKSVLDGCDCACRTNQLSWGSLDGSAGIYSIDSLADMIYLKQCIAFSGDFKQQMTNISSLMNN
ncbi:hypothetical protein ACFX2C_044688 [Malus domestica]